MNETPLGENESQVTRAKVVDLINNLLVPQLKSLQLEFEIAEAYRANIPVLEIADDIIARHPDSFIDNPKILSGAIRAIIKEILPFSDRKEIEFGHRSQHAKDNVKNKKGYFGLSSEERSSIAKKAGSVSGKLSFKNKTGLFALSPEQRKINSQKAVQASLEATGLTRWFDDVYDIETRMNEIEYAIALTKHPDFCYQEKGRFFGLPDNSKIAATLNHIFHNDQAIRTARSVSKKLCLQRKK